MFVRQTQRWDCLFQIFLDLANDGYTTARNVRVLVTHTETNCIAGGIHQPWCQSSGDRRLNPWNLRARHDLNPGERVTVLAINTCEQTPAPFSISVKVWAEDVMPTELHAIFTSNELKDGATAELTGGKPSDCLVNVTAQKHKSLPSQHLQPPKKS